MWRNKQAQILMVVLLVIFCSGENIWSTSKRQRGHRGGIDWTKWKTNTKKTTIKLSELLSGGPGKDGIPPIYNPKFISQPKAAKWLKPNEPIISLVLNGKARAYPLEILTWHEIVDDSLGGVPVAVSFCPLCYSAMVYDRRIDSKVYTLGVSGMLRHSDMVMYDKQTESLWQQIDGKAIVGDMVGKQLKMLPAQIISFEQFCKAYPWGDVLSRDTGYKRPYGRNPYVGYDDINRTPFLFRTKPDGRLKPMQRVVAVIVGKLSKTYPYTITRKKSVINDTIGKTAIVIFHKGTTVSALNKAVISQSQEVGSTGVFQRRFGGRELRFVLKNGLFVDKQTNSQWDITGKAVAGKLKGKQLKAVQHGDYFAFAWLASRPDTVIYGSEPTKSK